MVKREDIERLIDAHQRVQELLVPEPRGAIGRLKARFRPSPKRKAAEVLCDELRWLVHERPDFWRGIEHGSETLAEFEGAGASLFGNLEKLIDDEVAVFHQLGVDEKSSSGVISATYDALAIIGHYDRGPSVEAIRNLRERLAQATELVCRASRGPLRRTYDALVGAKGARILAGGAVAGANVLFATTDAGVLSWVSLQAGYMVMRGDVDGLIDLLKRDK